MGEYLLYELLLFLLCLQFFLACALDICTVLVTLFCHDGFSLTDLVYHINSQIRLSVVNNRFC